MEAKDLYYTNPTEAVQELMRRRKDKTLVKKVEDFLGYDLPAGLRSEPRAVLVRYVASPNMETHYFARKAKKSQLAPLFLEFIEDKLVSKNPMKYYLCKMHSADFREHSLKNGAVRIINFHEYEGKTLEKVKTLWGEPLVDFHHRLFELQDQPTMEIEDFSQWFKNHRAASSFYYLHYLALFLCHGILYENFLLEKREKEFTKNVVIPSFLEVERMFGLKPIILPLEPIDAEDNDVWYGYQESVINLVRKLL